MDLGIHGKVALITGASRGIGKAIALELAKAGCHCVITARGQQGLDAAVEEIKKAGVQVVAVASDINKDADRQKILQEALKTFDSIDILVNNAGGIDKVLSFEEIDYDRWVKMFDWNVFSVVEMIKLVLPVMAKNKWGRVINIASESGLQPDALFPHYNAAKAAILNLTKSLSKVYAKDGILVNAVSPAFIYSEQVQKRAAEQAQKIGQTTDQVISEFMEKNRPTIELKRMGQPEEVAAAVAFLASQQASFILGSNLRVDGGSVGVI